MRAAWANVDGRIALSFCRDSNDSDCNSVYGTVSPSENYPTNHFRHLDTTNVAFVDGHVETRPRSFTIAVPGPNFMSSSQAGMIEEKRLGYVSDGNLNDPNKQDELYDLK